MRRRSEPDSQRYHQHKRSISAERSKIGEDEPVDGFGEAYERQNEDEEKIEEREFNSSDENENSNNNNNNNSNNNNNNNNINNNNNNSSSHGEDDSNQREEANESRDNGRNHSPDNSNDFDSGNSSNKNNASFSGKSAPSRDSRQTMSSPSKIRDMLEFLQRTQSPALYPHPPRVEAKQTTFFKGQLLLEFETVEQAVDAVWRLLEFRGAENSNVIDFDNVGQQTNKQEKWGGE